MRDHLKILSQERRRRYGADGEPVYEETLDQVARRLLHEAELGRGALHRLHTSFSRGMVAGGGLVLAAVLVAVVLWSAL